MLSKTLAAVVKEALERALAREGALLARLTAQDESIKSTQDESNSLLILLDVERERAIKGKRALPDSQQESVSKRAKWS